jgi:anti-sigma factor RsiW
MSAVDSSLAHAFVDGELDLKSQLEMEQRLASDPTLRQQVEEIRLFRQELREHAGYHVAPDTLRQRVAALRPPARDGEPATASTPAAGLGRWLQWRPLAAGLSMAAVVMVAVQLAWLQPSRDEVLADEVVASHVRSTLGQRLVDVASSDQHAVKPFLSSKLGFSPPVSALRLEGSELLGGRVDYLDGRPVAALVYRQGQHVVDAYVWPGSAADRAPTFGAARGYRIAHWTQAGMNHWAISDLGEAEFEAVVRAMRLD